MARHGIPCPRVVQLRKHVLLMTFIGRNRVAAPKLKDAQLSVVDLQIAYEQIVQVELDNGAAAFYHSFFVIYAAMS